MPVIVTVVPPEGGPNVGPSPVMAGASMTVSVNDCVTFGKVPLVAVMTIG